MFHFFFWYFLNYYKDGEQKPLKLIEFHNWKIIVQCAVFGFDVIKMTLGFLFVFWCFRLGFFISHLLWWIGTLLGAWSVFEMLWTHFEWFGGRFLWIFKNYSFMGFSLDFNFKSMRGMLGILIIQIKHGVVRTVWDAAKHHFVTIMFWQ